MNDVIFAWIGFLILLGFSLYAWSPVASLLIVVVIVISIIVYIFRDTILGKINGYEAADQELGRRYDSMDHGRWDWKKHVPGRGLFLTHEIMQENKRHPTDH